MSPKFPPYFLRPVQRIFEVSVVGFRVLGLDATPLERIAHSSIVKILVHGGLHPLRFGGYFGLFFAPVKIERHAKRVFVFHHAHLHISGKRHAVFVKNLQTKGSLPQCINAFLGVVVPLLNGLGITLRREKNKKC